MRRDESDDMSFLSLRYRDLAFDDFVCVTEGDKGGVKDDATARVRIFLISTSCGEKKGRYVVQYNPTCIQHLGSEMTDIFVFFLLLFFFFPFFPCSA